MNKLNANIQRDKNNTRLLKSLGWKVLIIYECETEAKSKDKLIGKLKKIQNGNTNN
jgi:DNA mismatch endonuclease (patch repair protein)